MLVWNYQHGWVTVGHVADDAGVGPEASSPEALADHEHRVAARPAILAGEEGATEPRPHAEDVEVVGRDDLGIHPLGLVVDVERGERRLGQQRAGEDFREIGEVAEVEL